MTDFVGGSLLRWAAKPYTAAGKLGARAFNFTASPFLKVADRLLGSKVLEDLSSFVLDFQTLYDGFKRRADEVLRLLCSDKTAFVVVTTLEGPPLREAGFFVDRLLDEDLPFAGLIANKVVPLEFADLDPDAAAGYAHQALEVLVPTARRDKRRLHDLKGRAGVPLEHIPLLTHDVHDLDGLREIAGYVVRG
jgi:anion-transporting  ArsA/GET3 family ATPase